MAKRIYETFNYPNSKEGDATSLTGIREYCGKYYISGFYISSGINTPFVYVGDLAEKEDIYKWHTLNYPSSIGVTVTNTELYGPYAISKDFIRVVGNYKASETGDKAFGALYEGKLDGTGKWRTLLPSKNTINCIAHSVVKHLVVGNYQEDGVLGKAFIYDICKRKYYQITNEFAKGITAYGIVENDDCTYTICGGLVTQLDKNSLDTGYIVDWNNNTKIFSNWRMYKYQNNPDALVTHFDGISNIGLKGSYNLTGQALLKGSKSTAFFAKVRENKRTYWEEVHYPNSTTTTGNSIVDNIVIGIYETENSSSVNGYISTI